jgi:hypothetical protein
LEYSPWRSALGGHEVDPLGRSLAGHASVTVVAAIGGFSLLAVLVYVADEHPTFETGAWPLEASVVRLYGVVVIVSGWVRVGCARLFGVHS